MSDLIFGDGLSQLMRSIEASVSRRKFAATIGVDRATLKRWLEGKVSHPRELRGVSTAIQLALELGIDIGEYQSFTPIYDLTVAKSYEEKKAEGPPDISWLASSDSLPRHEHEWKGLRIHAPLGIASSPLVTDDRWICLMVDLGFDFISIKTRRRASRPAWHAPHIALVKRIDTDFAKYDPADPPVVIVELPVALPSGRIWDLVNSLGAPSETTDEIKRMFERVRAAKPQATVGMSLIGDGTTRTTIADDFDKAVDEYLELRASFYELNVSCPNRESADDFTDDIRLIKQICTKVSTKVRTTGSLLLLKLPFFTCDQMKRLLRAVGGEIDGVVYRNTLKVRPRQLEHDGRLIIPFPGREFAVFTEVNALPLDEESAGHHGLIGSAGRSPISVSAAAWSHLSSRVPDGGPL